MPALDTYLAEKITSLEATSLKRSLYDTEHVDGAYVIRNGKRLLSFCSNDYLGLSHHPEVIRAAEKALKRYGMGAGASRLVTGNHPLYRQLEEKLASLKGTEAALVFGSGYLTNMGVIPALMGKDDLIITDKLAHSCILQGVKLSGATHKRYSHNSLDFLFNILKNNRNNYKNCLIVTESVFSMDGDMAPLDEITALSCEYDAWVMVDDAHGLGIVAPHPAVDIHMGTLSKAAGVYGGYVCGSRAMIDYLVNKAATAIYSTALPPSLLAAAHRALSIIETQPELGRKALENARLFTQLCGLPKAQSTIVPLLLGEASRALELSTQLENLGLLVTAIRPPTVPKGTARLRFTFSALHEKSEIEQLVSSLERLGCLGCLEPAHV